MNGLCGRDGGCENWCDGKGARECTSTKRDGKRAAWISGRVQERAGDLQVGWPGWLCTTMGGGRRPNPQ